MDEHITGIHHVTAIASDPQRNLDFFTRMLGMRLVKLTVNFDDPGTYHFYFGDGHGMPGTILTFFPWPRTKPGKRGTGQVTLVSFAVPPDSMSYWVERLRQHQVTFDEPARRFDEEVISFMDPDRLLLELVATEGAAEIPGWEGGPVPPEHAIRGFHSVTLFERDAFKTIPVMEMMGFRQALEKGNRRRYQAMTDMPGFAPGKYVDIVHMPSAPAGTVAAGTVHHVAYRVRGDQQQLNWRSRISEHGLTVTPVLDRQYFHSIYFREPGGVLFEIATDPPGFTADEDLTTLGTGLKLPPWLEPQRESIARDLPRLTLPDYQGLVS